MTLLLRRRIIILSVAALFAALVLHRVYIFAANRADKGSESSAYTALAGPFETASADDLLLHDAQRNKDLRISRFRRLERYLRVAYRLLGRARLRNHPTDAR
jgi:hypothetical protein